MAFTLKVRPPLQGSNDVKTSHGATITRQGIRISVQTDEARLTVSKAQLTNLYYARSYVQLPLYSLLLFTVPPRFCQLIIIPFFLIV